MENRVISFVVPAHNEELLLSRTLESIHAAAKAVGQPYEIVVADDASTDRTAAVAGAAGARVVCVEHRQIGAVRNAGARQARGEVLVFVDADTMVTQAVLDAALTALGKGAVGGGALVDMDTRLSWWVRPLMLLWEALSRGLRWAAGCFIFVRRSEFEAVGGFDERYFVAEEIYLSQALKKRGRFVILRQRVTTSARKVRMYRPWQLLKMSSRLLWAGPKAWRKREGLEMWYEGKRES